MEKAKSSPAKKAPEKQPEKKEAVKEKGNTKKRRGTSDGSMAC